MRYLFLNVWLCSYNLAVWFTDIVNGVQEIKPWHYLIMPLAGVNFYFHLNVFLERTKCTKR